MHKKAEGMGRELGLPPSQTLTAPVRDLRILSAHGHISILQISKGALNITEKVCTLIFYIFHSKLEAKGKSFGHSKDQLQYRL